MQAEHHSPHLVGRTSPDLVCILGTSPRAGDQTSSLRFELCRSRSQFTNSTLLGTANYACSSLVPSRKIRGKTFPEFRVQPENSGKVFPRIFRLGTRLAYQLLGISTDVRYKY